MKQTVSSLGLRPIYNFHSEKDVENSRIHQAQRIKEVALLYSARSKLGICPSMVMRVLPGSQHDRQELFVDPQPSEVK